MDAALDGCSADGAHIVKRGSNTSLPSRDSCLGYARQDGKIRLCNPKNFEANMTNSAHSGAYYAQTDSLQAQFYAQADFCLSADRGSVRAMTIEDKIRAIMKATGWKQQKLAEHFRVSQSTVNRWLSGAEPEGPRRDAINETYAERVPVLEPTTEPSLVRDIDEVRAMLERIDGLKPENITVLLSAIQGFQQVNGVQPSPVPQGDQPALASRPHESEPSRRR
ncbi:helix-turn-helix transcriptional regulator [Mesorhizobium sp. B2-6-3]|uniref:helix-turn-helix domain-containing protein n=1 Tax=Mesorhizobium sp. B2-6-3 TaxID=2589914 RepID=UPI001FEEEA42|nr:helix-turn-helix transcriptional regulator [Mesorhizobium sp. B2-6-3]